VFTPLGLTGATIDGAPMVLEHQTEQGRNVYSLVVLLPPRGGTSVVRLDLRGTLTPGRYELEVRPQLLPVPDDLVLDVTTDGRTQHWDERVNKPETFAGSER
jgi:hypothetical protein